MLFRVTAVLGFLATSVVADGAAIVSALKTIQADNAKLNNTLLAWDGGLISALPILSASSTLEDAIDDGTTAAQNSAQLTDSESVDVYVAVSALSSDVNITIDNFIAAKPKFDNISVSFIVSGNLKDTKNKTDTFGAAVIAKVPSQYASIANGVIASIDAKFQEAIDAYAFGL